MIALPLLLIGFGRALWGAVRKDADIRGLLYLTLVLVAGGAFFYWRVEGWSFFNSLYFCVVTLATVGYGDFTPKTVPGKAFTMVYVLVGIGVLFAFVSKIASYSVTDWEERNARRRARREERRDANQAPAALDTTNPDDISSA